MPRENCEKTAASKGFSSIKQVGYHLGPPPVVKSHFQRGLQIGRQEQLLAQRLLNSGSTKYGGKEQTLKQGRILFHQGN